GSSSALAMRTHEYHPLWPNPARYAFLRWLAEYVQDKEIRNRALERTVRAQLRPYRYPRLYRFLNPLRYLSCVAHGYLRSIGHKLQGAVP
ncbi:MAG: hypothetical protein NZ578_12010, partial [Candidatus Binatia bacterium]|nr:hypothetical protein [Candidatus Binatia bacterium]